MDTPLNPLVSCPYCGVKVLESRVEKHRTARCPMAPAEIMAARPVRNLSQPRKAAFVKRRYDANQPDPPRPRTTPTALDRQIDTEAKVIRMYEDCYSVSAVLLNGASKTHMLSMPCPYCHRPLTVFARGHSDMPEFAKTEARRLALLEHLRTDHVKKVAPVKPEIAPWVR